MNERASEEAKREAIQETNIMKFLLRTILTLATIIGVLVLILGGVFLGTGGDLGFLTDSGVLPDFGSLQTTTGRAPSEPVTTGDVPGTLRFTWQGNAILYNENAISEADFATLLVEAEANKSKVEVIKFSDVSVESADRWRKMLDEAGVRYEVIPQE
jgi:hypothetical protein